MENKIIELFEVYYRECPQERIYKTACDSKKGNAYIILDNHIEIIHFDKYQGEQKIMFACVRTVDGGEEEFFFDSYSKCLEVWNMEEEFLKEYYNSLLL